MIAESPAAKAGSSASVLASARARIAALLGASLAYASLLVLLRGTPSVESDAGVFLSVAGRLLHGARLYVNVLDNKDPLFFYAHAAALGALGWSGPFLLDILWVAIAAASTLLLLRAVGASWTVAVAGFLVYPLLLTGAWYESGYSLLAALALAPLIGLLWLRGKLIWAGALLGLGVLFKVNLALVLVSVPLAILVLGLSPRTRPQQLARAAAGLGGVLAGAAAILAIRGELHGYLENLVDNVAYSHEVLRATGHRGGIVGHVKIAAWAASLPVHLAGFSLGKSPHLAAVVLAFVIAGVLAIMTLRRPRDGAVWPAREQTARVLAGFFLCATVTTCATLALTAAWFVHDQMLAFPGVMLIVFVLARFAPAAVSVRRGAAVAVAAGLSIVVLGGTAVAGHGNGGAGSWFSAGHSETAGLLERAAAARFPRGRKITFVHLGQNDEDAVAAFLAARFDLACPEIAQYVFTPELSSTLRCIEQRRPELILETPTFRPMTSAPAQWNQFVAGGTRLLAGAYERVLTQRTARGATTIWALAGTRAPVAGTLTR